MKKAAPKPRVPTGFELDMQPRCCRDCHILKKSPRATCGPLPCLLLAAPVILLLVLLVLFTEGVIG